LKFIVEGLRKWWNIRSSQGLKKSRIRFSLPYPHLNSLFSPLIKVDQILTNLTEQISNTSGFAHLAILILAMIVGLFLLTKGGDWLSDHSSHIAEALGVPNVVIGLTIISVATSAPELFTSIAAIRGQAEGLILGNIVGSNIANISLILGLVLLIKPIET